MSITPIRPPLYEAKAFHASTDAGAFEASGTLCGHIDFVGPFQGSYPLTPDEALSVIIMLQQARADVLDNSNPLGDPRLVDRSPATPLRLSGGTEGLRTSGAALGDKSAQIPQPDVSTPIRKEKQEVRSSCTDSADARCDATAGDGSRKSDGDT